MDFKIQVVKVFPYDGESIFYWQGVNGEDVRDLAKERGWTDGYDYEIDGIPADMIEEGGKHYLVPAIDA